MEEEGRGVSGWSRGGLCEGEAAVFSVLEERGGGWRQLLELWFLGVGGAEGWMAAAVGAVICAASGCSFLLLCAGAGVVRGAVLAALSGGSSPGVGLCTWWLEVCCWPDA